MILLIALISLFPQEETENWPTLLQRSYQLGCSADYLISRNTETGSLIEGLPFVAVGEMPLIPWTEVEMRDPQQGGLWGRGIWNVNFLERPFQDSLSLSKIGLIQNTKDHSRYLFQLDRPLPGYSSGNFQIMRDDSIAIYSSLLRRKNINFRIQSWEGTNYGWGSWGGWSSDNFMVRAGFSRLSHSDRRPELLASANRDISVFDLSLGGALAKVDSTLQGRGVAGLSAVLGSSTIASYFEYSDSGEAYWGGLEHSIDDIVFAGAFSNPSSEDMFQTISIRHPDFNIVSRFSANTSLAADISYGYNFVRGKSAVCWNFDTDSLSSSSWLLLGIDWYKSRFEAGPRFACGVDSTGALDETLDILVGFSLATFSFNAAVEHLTHDIDRNWSFGITWFFTDQAAVTPIDEEGERDAS